MVFLGINIKGFALSEQRQIRELVNTPQGTIEIYEPSIDDIAVIVDLQRNQDFGSETGVVSFDGVTVIRELFPLLTNIDLTDSTDEELGKIIANPTVHLLIAQQIVAQIVAESNKFYAERLKTELMQTESKMAQMELLSTIPSLIIEQAGKDGKIADLVEAVEHAEKELSEAIEREQEEEVTDESKV
jgi:hypothetical protein